MNTETKIQQFMQEFRTTYMEASDWLFANNDDYKKASEEFISWTSQASKTGEEDVESIFACMCDE